MFVGGVRLGVWGVVLVVCVCVGVGGVGLCLCVCDLLIFYTQVTLLAQRALTSEGGAYIYLSIYRYLCMYVNK